MGEPPLLGDFLLAPACPTEKVTLWVSLFIRRLSDRTRVPRREGNSLGEPPLFNVEIRKRHSGYQPRLRNRVFVTAYNGIILLRTPSGIFRINRVINSSSSNSKITSTNSLGHEVLPRAALNRGNRRPYSPLLPHMTPNI